MTPFGGPAKVNTPRVLGVIARCNIFRLLLSISRRLVRLTSEGGINGKLGKGGRRDSGCASIGLEFRG
jgi:hypothetical protein